MYRKVIKSFAKINLLGSTPFFEATFLKFLLDKSFSLIIQSTLFKFLESILIHKLKVLKFMQRAL